MKKIVLGALLCYLFNSTIYAQDWQCGSSHYEQILLQANPEIINEHEIFKQIRQEVMLKNKASRNNNQIYTIPIVFHIIHEYGSENISDAQVEDAVRILNEDFLKQNADTAAVVNTFKSIVANSNIQFKLATKDPNGNCTNGIVRYASHKTNNADDESKLVAWPRNRYLNIWVVKTIGRDGVAGYAYKPASVNTMPSSLVDGIIILHNYIGSTGTSNDFRSRALTHEVGHTLTLDHPWGPTNQPGVACGDDDIDDTPVTRGWTNCNLAGSICNPPIIENVQNFMEYSYCSRMFTHNQVEAMRATLELNIAQRNNLWQPQNLILTGTNDAIEEPICAPIANFSANRRFVCVGDQVIFNDRSWRAKVDARTWEFEDATPSTASSPSVNVTFNSPGWKKVKITVNNISGIDSKEETQYILVRDNNLSQPDRLFETFENLSNNNDWVFESPIHQESAFGFFSGAGFSGNNCIRINSYEAPRQGVQLLLQPSKRHERDYFFTPPVNIQGKTGVRLAFRYSGSTQSSNLANVLDVLNIHASRDCGKTWINIGKLEKNELVSAGFQSSAFTPSSSDHWRLKTFAIPSNVLGSNTIFRFEYINGGNSNNFYIDDIQVDMSASLNDFNNKLDVKIYPNPNNGKMFIENLGNEFSSLNLIVRDFAGKVIHQEILQLGSNGQTSIELPKTYQNKGIYFGEISTENQRTTFKWVIN
jgi:PKD repeat protein